MTIYRSKTYKYRIFEATANGRVNFGWQRKHLGFHGIFGWYSSQYRFATFFETLEKVNHWIECDNLDYQNKKERKVFI